MSNPSAASSNMIANSSSASNLMSSPSITSSLMSSSTTASTDLGQPFGQAVGSSGADSGRALRPGPRISPGGQGRILVISGGDGYEDFSSSASSDLAGRED